MSYASSIAQINSDASSLESLCSAIKGLDMDSIWEGPAHDKQKSNMDSLLAAVQAEIQNCNTLTNAMALIDQYDVADENVQYYSDVISGLNRESENYQSNYNYYMSKYNSAVNQRNSLKSNINSVLSSISSSYSETLSDLSPVEVVSTVEIYNDTLNLESSISSSLDVKKIVSSLMVGSLDESNMYPDFSNLDAWVNANPYAGPYTGQCTWFAWGRFYEIYGYDPGFTGNGNDCVGQLLNTHPDKFEKSNTPVPGAVFSTGLNERYGHVGIVLEVDEENDRIVIQDGNYNGQSDSFAAAQSDWGTRELSLSDFNTNRGGTVYAVPKK